ncbi:MAG: cysteine desulfurase [Gammaproteobacteria bacterium]|nr:cysteine desulfurase [Gammaproteobacteria bacterium]MCH9743616.1 cysteine desulfurase [Gammaproteobacteria bacterium]
MNELWKKQSYQVDKVRKQFPLLQQLEYGKPLVYLDNAATTQKPQCVIDSVNYYYEHDNANVHRGIYALSERATAKYEATRQAVRNFINAKRNHEIIITAGTTASINLVADTFGRRFVKSGDEVVISTMEHHSNIVPWQQLCKQVGATLKVIPMFDDGTLDVEAYERLLTDKTRIVALTHMSNVLGTINPIKQMIDIAHERHIPVFVDGAQAVAHVEVDVEALDCDFYAFSSHKMYGPTGVGILYGKTEWLEIMPPYQMGGDMIKTVGFDHTEFNVLPHKFEAGTPNVAGVVGLGDAIHFLEQFDPEELIAAEHELLTYASEALSSVKGLRIIGTAEQKSSVISFVMQDAHPHDISTILNDDGIAIRAGHHCAMPLMGRLGVAATARLSLGIYNNRQDVDRVVAALHNVLNVFEVS